LPKNTNFAVAEMFNDMLQYYKHFAVDSVEKTLLQAHITDEFKIHKQ
jgi:hypothetical protein